MLFRSKNASEFEKLFAGQFSEGFNPELHLKKLGVINQTTQLSSDTLAISEYLKKVMIAHYKPAPDSIVDYFADTRDTLCYATNDNQTAVKHLLQTPANLAIVIGGYNSSNSSHLVELCEQQLPTFFIDSADRLLSSHQIEHRNWQTKELVVLDDYLPKQMPASILITSGASCPDSVVESVIQKLAGFYSAETALESIQQAWCS